MHVVLTRARRSLSIYVPRRSYRRPQGRDDGHGYGKASRFLTQAVQTLCDVAHLPDDAPRGPFAAAPGAAAANCRVGRRVVHVDLRLKVARAAELDQLRATAIECGPAGTAECERGRS